MYKYIIQGEPKAWKRPGGQIHRYDTQKHDKLVIGIELSRQHGREIFTLPLHIELIFYIKHPKCSSKKEELVMGTPCATRPDLDNYIKLILDCASNGVLYNDDNIITSLLAKKIYDPQPRTEIIIYELK